MTPKRHGPSKSNGTISRPFWAVLTAFICFGLLAEITRAQGDQEKSLLDIDPANFSHPTKIDNPWWPLKPGMQYVYEGVTVDDEGETVPHRTVFTVTDLTKVINGIRCVVIWDRDFSDGALVESELVFFAQDNDGNIWHLGQHVEVYDERDLLGYYTWLVGHQEGTKAGIMMKAKPKLGEPSYSQGYAPPPFNWTDRAKTYKMGETTKVPYGSFQNVLVMAESSDKELNAYQLKYYAPGVGVVRVDFLGKDPSQERLELVAVNPLSPEQMADIRAGAFKLETRAYVYGSTPPMEVRPASKKTLR